MTTSSKTWKKSLRTLSATQLQSVAGGIIGIYVGNWTGTVGNPEDSTSFTGGVSYLPAVQR